MRKLEQTSGHLTEFQAWREDIGWQNRSASLIDLDEMIGAIVAGIEELGVLNNTVRVRATADKADTSNAHIARTIRTNRAIGASICHSLVRCDSSVAPPDFPFLPPPCHPLVRRRFSSSRLTM